MDRDIIEALVSWKTSRRRQPLLLSGVRQCGKTYALMDFGRQHFGEVVYLNFEETPGLAALFEFDFDVRRIVRELSFSPGVTITPGKTLLIMDEIQECPRAITALKYFCENMRDLHVA